MEVLKQFPSATHMSFSPTMGDSDATAPDAGSSSSDASPSFNYDRIGLKSMDNLALDQPSSSFVTFQPAPAGFLNPYGSLLQTTDFALASMSADVGQLPTQYFFSPATGLAFSAQGGASMAPPHSLFFSSPVAPIMHIPTTSAGTGLVWSHDQGLPDDMSAESYKQVG